jgi:hypothetical protein
MTFLPQDTELGTIALIEIYIYYDRPCFFSCLNAEGKYFLALWIDETLKSDRWLYAPVAKAVLNNIQAPDFNFRSAFQDAAGDRVFDVEVFNDGRSSNVTILNCSELLDELLPI